MKTIKPKGSVYKIGQVIEDVADSLRGYRIDLPMIRTAINDRIDQLEKDDWRVCEFNQDKAVRKVCKLLN